MNIPRSSTRSYGEPGHTSLSFGRPIVTGWGRIQNMKELSIVGSEKLKAATVPVVSNAQCKKEFRNFKDGLQ